MEISQDEVLIFQKSLKKEFNFLVDMCMTFAQRQWTTEMPLDKTLDFFEKKTSLQGAESSY